MENPLVWQTHRLACNLNRNSCTTRIVGLRAANGHAINARLDPARAIAIDGAQLPRR
jgi:hypothetical protein